MAQMTIPSDLYVAGAVTCKSFVPPAGSITDAAVQAGAAIQATKIQHQHQKVYAQESATSCTSETRVIHVVYGATGTLIAFQAGAVVPITGNDTVTVDLRKNGSTVLSAAITLNSSQTARQLVSGTLSSSATVVGDVWEVVITYTHNTGTAPKGVFCQMVLDEAAQ